MSSESEARAALRSPGFRLSGYKGAFTILDAAQTYVTLDEDGAARRLSLEEVTAGISEFRAVCSRSPTRHFLPVLVVIHAASRVPWSV